MRMDIENSPDARPNLFGAAARHCSGHAGADTAAGNGVIGGKCICRTDHPASFRGEHACRPQRERGLGVLWRHAGVNLVAPGPFAWPRLVSGPWAGSKSVSTPGTGPQPRRCRSAAPAGDKFMLTMFT